MYDQRDQTISRSNILYGTNADDVWFNLDQFYRDQIQEVNQKLAQLDDEIWGKIVLMEKNKRVAKAYLRTTRFRIDGSCHEFDGQRIGFKSLKNPMRDPAIEEIREKIGVILIKMDLSGNILAKRCDGSSPVIIQGWDRPEAYCHGADITKSRGRLEIEKPARIFDMRVFKASVEQELRQPYPDRKKLLYKSAIRISLVKDESHPFKTPCWFMLINLVALDMLNANVPSALQSVPGSNSSEGAFPSMSRCQSISTELQLAGNKHLSVSSNDLYFSARPMPSPTSNAYREAASPVWSDTYEDLTTTASAEDTQCNLPTDRLLSAQMANSLALGYGGYSTLARPRWSTTLARSMDCLYSTALSVAPPSEATKITQPKRCFTQASTTPGCSHETDRNMRPVENGSQYACRRSEQRKTHAIIHHARNSDTNTLMPNDKDQVIYGNAIRAIARRPAVPVMSDSESSSSSGGGVVQQQEIYESSSTNSSNSSSGVSCRPSSPSIASETASESHHSADSVFNTESNAVYSKTSDQKSNPSVMSSANRNSIGAISHNLLAGPVAPEPPPRPQSLFKNTIRSKLFGGLNLLDRRDQFLDKRAALARYNNIRLDDPNPTNGHFTVVGQYGVKNPLSTDTVQSGKEMTRNDSTVSSSDSESEIYRL